MSIAGQRQAEVITVDLFLRPLDLPRDEIARLHTLLSADEQARAARFVASAHGDAYVAGRGQLREILAGYIGLAPQHLTFAYGTSGKPSLAHDAAPHFNLSHTGNWALLAVSKDVPLGVDIESVRSLKDDIAGRFFADLEITALKQLPVPQQTDGFYRLWTRKEAFIKATGDGFNLPLKSFVVSIEPETPRLLSIAGAPATELDCWHLAHFEPRDGVTGALALKARTPSAVLRLNWR